MIDRGLRRPTGRTLFASVRMSHSERPQTLAFHKEVVCVGQTAEGAPINTARVVWDVEPVDLTAEQANALNRPSLGDGRKSRSASVKEFIRDMIAGGPILRSVVVERGAAKNFNAKQLWRALLAVGGASFKCKGGTASQWMWARREHVPKEGDIEIEGEPEE